ncbi:MAG TPA: peptidase M24 family protein [Selenomonas sp.]|nr:aminopeptidase P family protein [Selenomonadaceae bacterium]HCB94113.1 peptidase M24 family protein [Selenomonas sp.]
MNGNRLDAVRNLMEEHDIDALLINKLVHLHYFSGFRGDDSALLIFKDRALLITDSRYTEQAAAEAPDFEIICQKDGLWKKVSECVNEGEIKVLGFESNAVLYETYEKLRKLMGQVEFKGVKLDELRQVKDEEEIALIRKACEIADSAFLDIIEFIRPGISEIEVAARLEQYMRSLGSERPAFATIVASGKRGSMPHGIASEKLIVSGEFVTMDYGAVYKGYHSDITRTICVGKADDEQRRVYEAVLSAQLMGLSNVTAGASGKAVDKAARDCLKAAGLDEYFGHGLGHSLGLEIHEEPRLSPKSNCEHLLNNMLVTVEPGVYIPGWGGIRIEDTVLVKDSGGEPLTLCTKQLLEV